MKKRIKYNPLSFQKEFHYSQASKVYLSAGFGAGKTYSLIMKSFKLMDWNPGCAGGILVPSLKMYKRDVLPTIQEILDDNGMIQKRDYHHHRTEYRWYFPWTKSHIWVFPSGDKGDSIRGPNLGWGLINEVTMCHEMAFKHFLARVRVKKAKVRQIGMSGTPEGFNWAYDYFIENPRSDTHLIFGDSRENTHVADGYIKDLVGSYDAKMQEQYVSGKFVNILGNTVAWAFDRRVHTAPDIRKVEGAPVWVTVDFNVNPMSATLWSFVRTGMNPYSGLPNGFMLYAWKTIKLEHSNTPELCDALWQYISPMDEVVLFPDPAGRSRDTRSRNAQSDFDILTNKGFVNLEYKSRPNVRGGVLAMNALLGANKVMINSVECKDLVADLEQCVFAKGADKFEIDKAKNPMRSHWLDGFKNMAEIKFPIQVDRSGFREHRYL